MPLDICYVDGFEFKAHILKYFKSIFSWTPFLFLWNWFGPRFQFYFLNLGMGF
jgi:hypothetical protein